MKPFNPELSNFIKLDDPKLFPTWTAFEYKNHPLVNGVPDLLRINFYLSRDGDYTRIWHGLLEPAITAGKLDDVDKPEDFDFDQAYNEMLFVGYIEFQEEAECILKALRFEDDSHFKAPLQLGADSENKIAVKSL